MVSNTRYDKFSASPEIYTIGESVVRVRANQVYETASAVSKNTDVQRNKLGESKEKILNHESVTITPCVVLASSVRRVGRGRRICGMG